MYTCTALYMHTWFGTRKRKNTIYKETEVYLQNSTDTHIFTRIYILKSISFLFLYLLLLQSKVDRSTEGFSIYTTSTRLLSASLGLNYFFPKNEEERSVKRGKKSVWKHLHDRNVTTVG